MGRLLLLDDDPGVLFALRELFADRGHEVLAFAAPAEALRAVEGVDAAIVDLQMPAMDGLAVLRAIRERDETIPVIILTAQGSERAAVSAMRGGAWDYQTKPFDNDEIVLCAERAMETHALRGEKRRRAAEHAIGRPIIGEGPAMRRLLDAVARIARRDVTVLVRGETGTGKELVASLLHAQSRRAGARLVRFNCAAIPSELAEAELFGHARGAFTGAQASRAGFFAQADGGTLVLDEVGELPPSVQAKLLRALQEGEIQPVGSGRIERVDVRVVACTNRDLLAAARAGAFREDLYYRLAVMEIVLPPLRERREDIPPLARELARRCAERFDLPVVTLAPALVARLAARDYPGNVRELENVIARLVALSDGGLIEAESLDGLEGRPAPAAGGGASLREQVEAFERDVIARALALAAGNQSEAARILATSRQTLADKIRRYGLDGAR